MIPEYPKLKPIELEDKNTIAKYLSANPKTICEFALANFFVWKDFDRSQATIINDNLCMMINPINEAPYFLEPVGKNKLRETADVCLAHIGRISRASTDLTSVLKGRDCSITPMRNQFDYVYLTSDMAELKGKRFDGKRNHLKRFTAQNPGYEFVPLTFRMKAEALDLFEKWFAVRKESRFFPRLAQKYQRAALEAAFSLYDELDLMGGVIVSGKKMLGFIIGSRLNPDTTCAHFSYGDPVSQGISQALFFEGANKLFNKYKYMNLEQDLGIPGLRTAKLSYHPVRLEEKFHVECKA